MPQCGQRWWEQGGSTVLLRLGEALRHRSRRDAQERRRAGQGSGALDQREETLWVRNVTATRGAHLTGLATNLGNPKASVFAVSLIPQFFAPHGPVFAGAALLGLIWALTTATWCLVFVTIVDRGRSLVSRPAVSTWLHGITGVVLLLLGAGIAFGVQPFHRLAVPVRCDDWMARQPGAAAAAVAARGRWRTAGTDATATATVTPTVVIANKAWCNPIATVTKPMTRLPRGITPALVR